MTEFEKFKRRLRQHPGVPVAAVMSVMFILAGASAGLVNIVAGLIASLSVWLIVVITAWNDRNIG
jgi:hypothetical protein